MSSLGPLERIRAAEFEGVERWFHPDLDVLELGGGNGFQARQLAQRGCRVRSLDLTERPTHRVHYFPVEDYDGLHIPSADSSIDVVFSSNVLEHVVDLRTLLSETRRVLRPGGYAVHLMPTPTFRVANSVAHYPYVVKYLLTGVPPMPGADDATAPTVRAVAQRRGRWHLVKRALSAGVHGEFPSAIHELYHFSRVAWRKVFLANGFELLTDYPAGVFYSGYNVVSRMSIDRRRRLGALIGSSCRVYVVRPV